MLIPVLDDDSNVSSKTLAGTTKKCVTPAPRLLVGVTVNVPPLIERAELLLTS